ncbi:hypothetical protein IWW37_002617 [Coemansia sp. RSA 2050]|nr:hypothetical protein IWW37_002617 [Coemansia sp. RSA 2050]
MVRHSKNNTASGVFTYAERQMVDYGTKTKRLGSDSKRQFDSCYLCLNTARVPMVCPLGHISCRECVLQSILEQKRTIEQAKKEYADFQAQQASDIAEQQKDRESQEVQGFIEREVGLSQRKRLAPPPTSEEAEAEAETDANKRPKMIELASRKGKEVEKPRLPSFWVPSLAPTAKSTVSDPSGLSVQCHASSPAHGLRLKHLVAVVFRVSAKGEKLCPSCDRPLLNSTKVSVLAKCGHAVCQRCVVNFVLSAQPPACVVCQTRTLEADVVRLESEGTGFTGAGGRMVATRYGSAFQA